METVLIDGGTITVLPESTYAMTVHSRSECVGRTCVIHQPTDHPMRSYRLHWRGDRGIFERICPHGVGHPDPDQQAYWRELAVTGRPDSFGGWASDPGQDPDDFVEAEMTHGCDGCCAP